jgi:sugar fermentation stimulation protein A
MPHLVPGRFLQRDNRFRATVTIEGVETWAHVPNSGRLTELFTPGRRVWLAPADAPQRKTRYDLKLVAYAGGLVSVDARLPNVLFAEALAAARLDAFPYDTFAREVTCGESRLDFHLHGRAGRCWVEAKSVTLVEEGIALFPDAPTARGRRHLATLQAQRRAGTAAAVVFIVQRADALAFRPHPTADPAFATALRAAAAAGVALHAYRCHVSLRDIRIEEEIAVELGPKH